MMHALHVTVIAALSALFFAGCGVGNEVGDSNVTLSVRVSALHYLGDNNETNETRFSVGAAQGSYSGVYGAWDFYDANITGERVITKAMYIASDANCSFAIEENATAPTLKAPADGLSRYPYLNVNPFTTLLVDENVTLEELAQRYPTAASIDAEFNFDVVSARFQKAYIDSPLTDEICDALGRVITLQP
ncbi:MAG: hypothetical protein JXK05_04310 [Campylobacterales bacterium]|nr:hypothetical protein [Campylobacterales bacterium]